jgi:hypothetical protein
MSERLHIELQKLFSDTVSKLQDRHRLFGLREHLSSGNDEDDWEIIRKAIETAFQLGYVYAC